MKHLFNDTNGVDEKSLESLLKALERNTLTGFDYLKFKSAIISLKQLNLDETTAIKSAFMTAAAGGLTKEKLLETAQHYRTVIAKEKDLFDAATERHRDQRIGEKLKQVATLKQQIADNELKIKQLQEEMEKATAQVREADFEIEQAAQKIDEAKAKFGLAHQTILGQIEQDIQRMQSVL
jgi:chromosome segregation ATPase